MNEHEKAVWDAIQPLLDNSKQLNPDGLPPLTPIWSDERLAQPSPVERFKKMIPTLKLWSRFLSR